MAKNPDRVFFVLLEKEDQHDLLKFARVYLRVRELDMDKQLSIGARLHYRELEAKLIEHLED